MCSAYIFLSVSICLGDAFILKSTAPEVLLFSDEVKIKNTSVSLKLDAFIFYQGRSNNTGHLFICRLALFSSQFSGYICYCRNIKLNLPLVVSNVNSFLTI